MLRTVSESQIERAFCRKVRERGGVPAKFVSPGLAGVPDRLLLLPGGRTLFIEFKAPGGHLRALQRKRHDELRSLGFDVRVIDSHESANLLLEEVLG